MQEAGLIDDRFRRGNRCDGSSATNTQSQVADSFNDSIELGMPHEPLSITFFKTAFSMSNMTGRRKDLPPEYLENMRLYELGIIEVMPPNPNEPPAPISNALLDGLNAETLARLQAQRREQDMDGVGTCPARAVRAVRLERRADARHRAPYVGATTLTMSRCRCVAHATPLMH